MTPADIIEVSNLLGTTLSTFWGVWWGANERIGIALLGIIPIVALFNWIVPTMVS